jgi:hypothetical protein
MCGRRAMTVHFTVIEISHPSAGEMHDGKNRDSDEVDDAE